MNHSPVNICSFMVCTRSRYVASFANHTLCLKFIHLDPTDVLQSSVEYMENLKSFTDLPKRGAAVVLVSTISGHGWVYTGTLIALTKLLDPIDQDVFAGIGSGIISLKRLGIDMRKIIHVEHDKVATHGT